MTEKVNSLLEVWFAAGLAGKPGNERGCRPESGAAAIRPVASRIKNQDEGNARRVPEKNAGELLKEVKLP